MAPTVVFCYCRNAFLTDKTNRLICTFSDAKYFLLQSAIKILPSLPRSRSSDVVLQFLCRSSTLTLCMRLHTTPVNEVFFFFFFSRRYNPWWVLACFTISFHNLLSLHFSLQFLTFIFFKSSFTWSRHLNLGP